jgi:hypothetical protein
MEFVDQIQESDPKSSWILRTINGVGLSIEQMVEQAVIDSRTRKGVIAGMAAAGPLVDKIKSQVMKEVDDQKMDGEQAKVVLQWLEKARSEINQSVIMNQKELTIQEGIVEGLKKAVEKCEFLFKQEENKVRVRMNESERGNRDEGGRPLPIREMRGEEVADNHSSNEVEDSVVVELIDSLKDKGDIDINSDTIKKTRKKR